MSIQLLPGDTAPWFKAQLVDGPMFNFESMGGRPIVLLLMGSTSLPGVREALMLVAKNRELFRDANASFFGVSINPSDETEKRIQPQRPGIRFFMDADHAVSKKYGAMTVEGQKMRYTPYWVMLDPTLRVIATASLGDGESIMARVRAWRPADNDAPAAPVLVVPNVFEPDMCQFLIAHYKTHGGEDSGFMNEVNGMTVAQTNHEHKRRSDCFIEDEAIHRQLSARLKRFLVPAVQRAFQFEATHIERYIVACYDSADGGGHFRPHRDNTTAGTAHRRFACTINLNAGDYEGGDLRFPEYGSKTYRAPTGGAVIFSCSMLHEATRVTSGTRYAFLPFLYDGEAAELRERNLKYLVA